MLWQDLSLSIYLTLAPLRVKLSLHLPLYLLSLSHT